MNEKNNSTNNSNSQFKQFITMNKTGWSALGFSALILIVAAIIFKTTDNSTAKQWDLQWSYIHILITAGILVIGILINIKGIVLRVKQKMPSVKSLLFLSIIVTFFGVFTYTQIEKQHRVLSDETSWESMALQMHYNFSGGTCNQGYFHDDELTCTDEVNNFKGKASGFAYKIAYSILGEATRDQALEVNFVFYIFSIVFLFYGFFLALNSERTALISTIFFASFPTMMFQSQTATTEVMYVFLFSLLFCLVQLFKGDPSNKDLAPTSSFSLELKHFILIIPLLGFFAQTRQETLFCFLPFVFYYHNFFKQKSWYLPAFTFLVLVASFPIINTICAYKGYGFQGGDYDAHSFWNLTTNFWTNVNVLLNWGSDHAGMLKRPYNTTVSILLYLGVIYFTIHVLFNKKYRWGYFLVLMYQLQAIVIMVNVSGNFTIDINQRYILVGFPTFALIIGLFLKDFTDTASTYITKIKSLPYYTLPTIALLLMVFLTMYHKDSFNANIQYRKNKLLAEEALLNIELKKLPKNSIFIYSRPWQMLAQGHNAFSESKLLHWSDAEYAKWKDFSGNNIYLVRGQDGFGKVNRKSRVVGFKTTDKVDEILNMYHTKEVYKNSKDFGYPLSITKLNYRKDKNKYLSSLYVKQQSIKGDSIHFTIHKQFPEAVSFKGEVTSNTHPDQRHTFSATVTDKSTTISVAFLSPGMNSVEFNFTLPDSTPYEYTEYIFNTTGATLLTTLPPWKSSQSWGALKTNRSVENNELTVDGKRYTQGLGTHSFSTVEYKLNGNFNRFHTSFGLDDESMCGDGIVMKIYGDNTLLFSSDTLSAQTLGNAVQNSIPGVDISRVETLKLVSDSLSNNNCDHANWINPWLE